MKLVLVPTAVMLSATVAFTQTTPVPGPKAQNEKEAGQLAYGTFSPGEAQLAISATCNADLTTYDESQPEQLKEKQLCEALSREFNSNPTTTDARQVVRTKNGTMVAPDFSNYSLGDFGIPKSDEKKVESVTKKSGFMYTVQRLGGKFEDSLNPEVQFFGLYAERVEGHTAPFMAAAVQFRKEMKKVVFLDKLGVKKVHITVLTNPFAALAIPQIRSAVQRSEEFNEGVREAAIHHISAATGIPADHVEHLVPAEKIEAAVAQAHAVATKELNRRVSYANGLRTMINEAYATFFFTDEGNSHTDGKTGWTLRVGKISPNQQRSLLESSTNLMFSAAYQASLRMSRTTWAATFTTGAMLGPWESPTGGLVESYIKSMIERGADYFRVKPNGVDLNLEIKDKFFEKHGIPFVTKAMIGGGAISGRTFGYLRVDAEKGPISGNYMAYWQACKSGNEDWLGCYEHRSVQKRQYGLVKAELHKINNPVAKAVAQIAHEAKVEIYQTKGSQEPFTMVRGSAFRPLPGILQAPCRIFGSCGIEASFAQVKVDPTAHEEHGKRVTIMGMGLILGFEKPKAAQGTQASTEELEQLRKTMSDLIVNAKLSPSDVDAVIVSKTGSSKKLSQLTAEELKEVLKAYGK